MLFRSQSIPQLKTALNESSEPQDKAGNIFYKENLDSTIASLINSLVESKKDQVTLEPTIVEKAEPILFRANDFFTLAETNRKNQQYKEAIKNYTDAIKKDKLNDDFYFYRAMCYAAIGHPNNAIDDYSIVIKSDPQNDAAINNRGECYYKLHNYKNAIADFYEAWGIRYMMLYYDNWIKTVKETSNISALSEYLSKHFHFLDDVYLLRGKLYLNEGDKEKAIADFIKAKELKTVNGNCFLGWEDEQLMKSVLPKRPGILRKLSNYMFRIFL